MRFKFKAIKKNGERYEGVVESPSRFDLYNEMKSQGNLLISAQELNRAKIEAYFQKFFSFAGNVSISQKINFAKNLSAMIKAGLPLSRALSVIEGQTKNANFRRVVEGLNLEIKKGKSLAEAFKIYPKVFSSLFISMTKAGEESGKLAESLSNVALQMDKTYRLQKKVRGAMIYPSVIVSVMVIVGVLMFIFVVPGIVKTFQELNTELPLTTQVIIWLSNFLTEHWALSLFFVFLVILGIYSYIRTSFGRRTLDLAVVKMPLIGDLIRNSNAARVSRTLSSLLTAGVPVSQSLSITREIVNNYYYRQVLDEATKVVEKGENISTVFTKKPDLYPSFVGEMMAVGEETGNMATMLYEVAIFYETDVEERTKDLSTIIEPLLMVVIGAAVGFFALSMIAPIYSVMDSL